MARKPMRPLVSVRTSAALMTPRMRGRRGMRPRMARPNALARGRSLGSAMRAPSNLRKGGLSRDHLVADLHGRHDAVRQIHVDARAEADDADALPFLDDRAG